MKVGTFEIFLGYVFWVSRGSDNIDTSNADMHIKIIKNHVNSMTKGNQMNTIRFPFDTNDACI